MIYIGGYKSSVVMGRKASRLKPSVYIGAYKLVDIPRLIKHVGTLKPTTVAGHSLGAYIAYKAVRRMNHKPTRLILTNPFMFLLVPLKPIKGVATTVISAEGDLLVKPFIARVIANRLDAEFITVLGTHDDF